MLTNVAVVDWVIDRTVRRGLLRGVVAIVGCGVGAISGGTWLHLGSMTIVSVGSFASLSVSRALPMMTMLFGRSKENRVISVSLDMLLQILRTLEGLPTEVTFVRLQRNVDSDVGSDMITLDSGSSARVPSTGEVQVICALSSDMFLADMFKKSLRRRTSLRTFVPLTGEVVVGCNCLSRSLCSGGRGRFWLRFLGWWCRHLGQSADDSVVLSDARFGRIDVDTLRVTLEGLSIA